MFKFVDNKKEKNLILLSGWAFDYKIFESFAEKLPYNLIFPNSNAINPRDLSAEICNYVKTHKLESIDIFAWSMGVFIAMDFLQKYAQDFAIKKVFLASAARNYSKNSISKIKIFLNKNKNLYLYNFYKKCFFDEKKFEEFDKNFGNYYRENFDLQILMRDLEYLEGQKFEVEYLEKFKNIEFLIVNSEDDEIVENPKFCDGAEAENVKINFLKNYGHAFFLENESFLPFKDKQ